MTTKLFYRIRDGWGLDPINTTEGERKVSDEEADLTYVLPGGEANLYQHEDSTGDFIVEVPSSEPEHPNMYLSGSDKEFEQLDSKFMQEIEEQSSSEYYKKIR